VSQAIDSRRQTWQLSLLAVVMFAFGFVALPPLYRVICDLTGQNGQDLGLVAASAVREAPDQSRLVTVQFVTTVNGGRDWGFKSEHTSIKVHPGQLYTVNFTARNPGEAQMIGQAVPSVTPWNAAQYLKKTECFCFRSQPFAPGEEKLMPVRFMLERELPADVDTVTLSYTFFDVTPQS
jgi:cytochrome c oxidase assembly protein subunit 11